MVKRIRGYTLDTPSMDHHRYPPVLRIHGQREVNRFRGIRPGSEGEQERSKKIIGGENDWIICRVNPSRGEPEDRTGGPGNGQSTTDFLEQYGTILEGIQPKGPKTQWTSESGSR